MPFKMYKPAAVSDLPPVNPGFVEAESELPLVDPEVQGVRAIVNSGTVLL